MYTSEGIPATTLHVSGIPNDMKQEDVLEHFGRFGNILDCTFKQPGSSRNTTLKRQWTRNDTYALITFENTSQASVAQRNVAKIDGILLKVTAADFWHQRSMRLGKKNMGEFPPTYNMMEDYVNIQDPNNILNVLNEYCFIKIFSYLPIQQLIQTERVSKHWNYLVHEKYKGIVTFKTNDSGSDAMRTVKLHLLLYKIGRYLKTLHLDSKDNSYENTTPYMIAKLCPNINELMVVNLKSNFWSYLMSKCIKLKSLHLHECDINDKTFENCSLKLEELMISAKYSSEDFLVHLDLRHLTKLSLVKSSIQHILTIDRFMSMSNLKELHLEGEDLDKSNMYNILKLFPELESLNLCSDNLISGLEPITDMKNLKKLKLHSIMAVNEKLIKMICSNCTELTNLEIYNEYPFNEITEKSFFCIWSLKNLKVLNICGLEICGMSFSKFVRSRISSKCMRYPKTNKHFLQVNICSNFDHESVTSRTVFSKNNIYFGQWSLEPDVIFCFCDCFPMTSFIQI